MRPSRVAGVAAGGEETTGGDEESLSYEQARDELVQVVKSLEQGGLTLEESLALWERGEKLADICGQWLEGARARLAAALARDDDAGEADGAGNGAGEAPF